MSLAEQLEAARIKKQAAEAEYRELKQARSVELEMDKIKEMEDALLAKKKALGIVEDDE